MNPLQREQLRGVKAADDRRVEHLTISLRRVRFKSPALLFAVAISLVLWSCATWASSREKTDLVYMKNGDKITCEIQSLTQGQLSVKPDYASSSFVIDWTKVDHVESTQQFVVTNPKGVVYSGSLGPGIEKDSLAVVNAATTTLPNNSVIEINQLGQTFWRRFRGNIDLGTNFARSNDQRNFTLDSGLLYQSTENLFYLNSNSQFTSQQRTNNTSETTVKTAFFQQLRKSNWYGGGIANFLASSEQRIDLRSTLGLALAKRAIFTNRTNLNLIGGLGYTIEHDDTDTSNPAHKNSLDAALAVQYSTFRFNSATFDSTLWVYPSLSSPGHVRMTFNQDVYYKFFSDFYISFSFYDNFDNEPVVGAPENNFGESTSIGWSFH